MRLRSTPAFALARSLALVLRVVLIRIKACQEYGKLSDATRNRFPAGSAFTCLAAIFEGELIYDIAATIARRGLVIPYTTESDGHSRK
jgi:hypothetical protein